MPRHFDPRHLDVRDFAEDGTRLEGEQPQRNFERLVAETQGRGDDRPVAWSAEGSIRNPGHVQPEIWLRLRAQTAASLTCQRCLMPVDVELAVDRPFRFVADESTAAAQDEEAEEDVLALSTDLDMLELVEDELLLAMPLVPHHPTCEPVQLEVADPDFDEGEVERRNPFDVLGRLKEGGNGEGGNGPH